MSNVVLSIGGRSFSVACADGEEQHIEALGKVIDEKVHALGSTAGSNEVRMLLYAALVLADELHEASAATAAPVAPAPPAPASHLPESLERIAVTLENLASRLEGAPSSP
jgi:cell division protein ZapA